MATLCGWAAIDERNRASGGKAGDQTGKEVHTGSWYYFGQNAVFRWKNRTYAKKYAKIIEAFCKNDHIGYDQGGRTTLYSLLKSNKWDYTKVNKNVECDCSALVVAAVNCTVGKALLANWNATATLNNSLMATGLFTKFTTKNYTKNDDYLKIGDIINAPYKHVISVLEDGSKVNSNGSSNSGGTSTKKTVTEIAKEVIAGKWGNGDERKKKLKAAGYDPSKVQKKVNELSKITSAKKSITEIAKEVIAGKWGNGSDRKKKLEKAGYDYEAVQKKVNELKK